jgi:hypothetical protein
LSRSDSRGLTPYVVRVTEEPPRGLPTLLDAKHKSLENVVALALMSAMLGLVTENLRAVAIDVSPDRIVVHFAFGEIRPADREDVEDILGDLVALLSNEDLPTGWALEETLYAGNADDAWPGRDHRRVFESKKGRLG